jgi:LPXTG-motif cell wall-anchored protein
MKPSIRTSLLTALLVSAVALPSAALSQHGPSGGPSQNKRDFGRSHAPEFDATVAGAIAAVIAGGGIILARRRRKS